MNTFLFAWNPNRWDWTDLEESIDQLETVGYVERRWSCGNSKSIKKGDRVFLIRLGKEPKGIMGSGYAKSSYYVAPHWDGTEGKTTNYKYLRFKERVSRLTVLNFPLIGLSLLFFFSITTVTFSRDNLLLGAVLLSLFILFAGGAYFVWKDAVKKSYELVRSLAKND